MPLSKLPRVGSRPGSLLYADVRDALHDAIRDGVFVAGARLPSTKDLAASMGVSLVTAHRAMQALEARGVIDRVQGRGTFVRAEHDRRQRRLAVVLQPAASLADYYHGDLLDGMNRAARGLNADLLIRHATEPPRRVAAEGGGEERPWGGTDGFLLINPLPEAAAAFAVTLADGGPSMLVGAHATGLPHVDVDNADLVHQAVDHLHGLGHRRILFVGGASNLSNSRDRQAAFGEACGAFKITSGSAIEAEGWRLDDSEKADIVARLHAPDAPTAVFAAGYYLTLDVYEAAGEAGRVLPETLSLVGVGDPISARHLDPPLTTMRQPLVELGRTAVEGVAALFDGKKAGSIDLKADLIVCQTTASPPKPERRGPRAKRVPKADDPRPGRAAGGKRPTAKPTARRKAGT